MSDRYETEGHSTIVHEPDIESAQRHADDLVRERLPHDCQQGGCSEWSEAGKPRA